jgi:tetratricopeptide (TPR) repeat protein
MTAPPRGLPALVLLVLGTGCAARSYTNYLIEPSPAVNQAFEEEEGTQLRPLAFGSTTSMRVSWNDGNVITEVDIPLLASGQRIVIEHSGSATGVPIIPATRLVPPPPTAADVTLDEAYRDRGLRVNADAAAVSISAARTRMQRALDDRNYELALAWAELVLARYPSHPETLRAKGSILLMLGERDKAIETYEAVEEIESDAQVRKKLEQLLREQP